MKIFFAKLWQTLAGKALPAMALVALTCAAFSTVRAQTCTYSIDMFDSFGDGWNGGVLMVISNGDTSTHTLLNGTNGSANFQVTNGAPLIMIYTAGSFASEVAFDVYDSDDILIYTSGPTGFPAPTTGEIYNEPGFCPNCPAPNSNLVAIFNITDSTAHVNWLDVINAEYYTLEYGPAGFPFGYGLSFDTTTSAADLSGLNAGVTYDVYIGAVCGIDSNSVFIGPYTFTTTYTPGSPGDTCVYTLQLFDSFGDGWNGSFLTVTHLGNSTNYGMATGNSITYTFTATSNVPIGFSYTAGSFQNEVTYNILDPNGIVIFSDGPYPATGDVFTTIACPTCPGPLDAWMSDVNANNATVSWEASFGAAGPYIVEYGPLGFTLGTGTADTLSGSLSSATLTGLLENKYYDVYVKLDCGTEFSKPVGPIEFRTLWLNDIGVTGITAPDPSLQCNLGANDTVRIEITNFGQLPQTLFEFHYAVNGVPANIPLPQDGLYTGVVGNDSTNTIAFETTWDFSAPGLYIIEAWTVLEGDTVPANDTFRYEILTAFPKPLKEDFEDNAVPATWVHDGFIYAPNSHNNPTYVLSDNLYSGDQNFTLTTQRIGPILDGDSLTFDYRYVNWSAGTIAKELGPGDTLKVQLSNDCGETFETIFNIDASNHVTSTDFAHIVLDISEYDGEAVTVQFLGTWGSGDYWLDLDNINILGCPPSLNLVGIAHPSAEGDSTGSIDLTPYFGTGPYSFVWSNADGDTIATTQNVADLPGGNYAVEVVDANGCSDFKEFELGTFVNDKQVAIAPGIVLYPNPASDRAFLEIEMTTARDYQVRLFNTSGQVLYTWAPMNDRHSKLELDMSQQAPGLYIVQILSEGKSYHAKLMVAR
ncbi:MAG: T9SS type A sorting domain-containing protein [Saprospiraceae bacterium]|nr:MAG: T9SS type A sorting domain-containing protein [Saprospiraceae bacterium]